MVQDEVCPVCCNEGETILHALRDCSHLKHVWNQLEVTASNHEFWHVNLVDWLSLNVRKNDKMHGSGSPWKIVFPFAIWSIWKSRNDIGKVGVLNWLWILCIKLRSIFIVWLLQDCKLV